ncbi:MAG: NADH-quinone oxidoreductase subunit N [Chitinophagaceae bacterium]|nr:NADH-quinone oxidoreductase subunit N [Chitinophagaceae bacterium]MBX9785153.1 NADH-quinone oxidoreductase subunit N [Chitinophagaceae bacterium]
MEFLAFIQIMKQELMLALIIFLLLFIKLGKKDWNTDILLHTVNVLLLINLVAGFFRNTEGSLFGNMYRTNELFVFEKNVLNLGVLLVSMQSYSWLKQHQHAPEFYMLLLSSLLGMQFLISSQNLLMFYLSLELSAIPIAALVNFDLDKKRSSEAAMKMIFSSAFASGLLLFGISFLYGTTGALGFTEISDGLNGSPLQIFSFVLVMAGFGFKISAVPFHLWTADVYEGAPVSVTAFLSVLSKGSLLFVLVQALSKTFAPLAATSYHLLIILSLATMLIGNLFAIRQQNLKRFLAFSSVAQVGFILLGLMAQTTEGNVSVVYFVLVYLFSNLGAFGVVSIISSATGKETINDLKGFYKTNPLLSWLLAIALFSLAGIPPTAGFFGKFFLIFAGAAKGNYVIITIAALNMVISLYYYLRIIKAMFMDANETPLAKIELNVYAKLAAAVCVLGIVITGLASGAYQYIYNLVLIN